jgi:hypothetical protein
MSLNPWRERSVKYQADCVPLVKYRTFRGQDVSWTGPLNLVERNHRANAGEYVTAKK